MSMASGGGLLCVKRSKASPKEWKVLEFPYISHQIDVGILPLCRSTGLASGRGEGSSGVILQYLVLSDSLHDTQERVGQRLCCPVAVPLISRAYTGSGGVDKKPPQPPSDTVGGSGSHPFLKSLRSSHACQGPEEVPWTKTSKKRYERRHQH